MLQPRVKPARDWYVSTVDSRCKPADERNEGGKRMEGNRSKWRERTSVARSVEAGFFPLDQELQVPDGHLLPHAHETLASMNAVDLVIDSADATMAGQLNWNHKDPFDRMIVTQAARRSLTIATSDTQLIERALTPVIDTRAAAR